MSWQSKAEQRQYKVVKNGTDFDKKSMRQTEVVWKDSKELGMARAKTPDGKYTYVVGRYRPAGNMLGTFNENVFKSTSKDPPSFIKASEQPGAQQESRVVERSWSSPGKQQTRVVVKETRTHTPQGVKTVKSTTTWTTSSNVHTKPTEITEAPQLESLKLSDERPVAASDRSSQSKPSGSFQEDGLRLHNQYRRLHQVPDMRWSNELARDAQAWAEKIASQNTLRHATSQERKGEGENLAYFGGKFGNVAQDAVNMWYEEEKKYKYKNGGFASGTGHFTQVVWKESTELGMGWAKSPDGRSVFIVGRYRPAGNVMGAFDTNVFPPKK